MGQHVTFNVDSYPNDTFEGTVTQVRLNPTTESNVVTYEVIVNTANPDHKLIPGMTANLTIYTLELTDVFAVPLKALRFQPMESDGKESSLPVPQPAEGNPKHSVWVVRDGRLVQTPVELGVMNSVYQQITSGLQKGDKVALQHNVIQGKASEGSQEQNPFMPKPPGSKKKK